MGKERVNLDYHALRPPESFLKLLVRCVLQVNRWVRFYIWPQSTTEHQHQVQ